MSIDPTLLEFDVESVQADGSTASLPWGSLTWDHQANEMASRITFSVPDADVVDGDPSTWIGQYVQPGMAILVNAGLPGALTEQTRGVIDGVSRGLDQQAPITVTCYDPLYDLLAEQVNCYYPAGTSAADVITDLCGQWNVTVGTLDSTLSTPLTGFLRYIQKTIGDIFSDVIAQTEALSSVTLLLRWNGGGGSAGTGALEVVQPGQNGTVLWFRAGASVLGGTETITRPSVTRILVYTTPQPGTDAYNADLQPTDTGSQAYVGPGVLIGPPLDSAYVGQFGVRQQIVMPTGSESNDQAIARAQTILTKPGQGLPSHQISAIVPLIPGVQRGDQVELTAGMTDGIVYVNGLSCDAQSRTMTMQLVSSQAELMDEVTPGSAESEGDDGSGASSATSPGTPQSLPGGGWIPGTPAIPQASGYTCSAASTAWMLTAAGTPTTEGQVVSWLGLGSGITSTEGLSDATGTGLAAALRANGFPNAQAMPVSFAQAMQLAGTVPMIIGGVGWDHWSGVSGSSGGALSLGGNPDLGGGAPYNLSSMTEAQFDQYGPFYAVYLASS